jgi:hypothetical protein
MAMMAAYGRNIARKNNSGIISAHATFRGSIQRFGNRDAECQAEKHHQRKYDTSE